MGRIIKYISTLTMLYLLFAGGRVYFVSAQGENSANEQSTQQQSQLIDIRANIVYPYKINDSTSVLCLVGEFAAQHNGAVITADSAVRYSDEKLECYGNVLINQNTTYAYAERADYDGQLNLATLYSDLVKVVDEDVTLYSYHFEFNTDKNIGRYWGGGVTIKQPEEGAVDDDGNPMEEDVMESERGYYYADNKWVIGVTDVEASGKGYMMRGDSVIYDMEREVLRFYSRTHIWSNEQDYLYGNRGTYDKAKKHYKIDSHSYILRPEQEAWSDSMEYFEPREEIILRGNLQLDDTTHRTMAFGDYGHYWGDTEQILLTQRPTMLNYDTQQSDSLFMRADTILVLSYAMGSGPAFESDDKDDAKSEARRKLKEWEDKQAEALKAAEEAKAKRQEQEAIEEPMVDSLAQDSLAQDSLAQDDMPFAQLDTLSGAMSKSKMKQKLKQERRDAISKSRKRAEMAKQYSKRIKRRSKVESRLERNLERGRSIYSDSMVLIRLGGELNAISDSLYADSLGYEALWLRDSIAAAMRVLQGLDTMMVDTISDSPELEKELPEERDSLYRVVKGFRNAKSYRVDMQMMCDSMTSISYDTVSRLYYRPIIWSEQHQIVSKDEVHIFTKDGNLDYADFIGDPIMGSQVLPNDTVHFNQVKGKTMRAWFEDNEIVRNDVDKNVETLYYMQDEETKEPNTLAQIESGSASFMIKNRELDGVTYRTNPVYVFAPLDMLPADMTLYLDEFEWLEELRPTRESIFNGTIRPSRRKEVNAIEPPLFDIREEIEHDKRRFERLGVWHDRGERLNPDIVEWMKDLGYTPEQPRKDNEGF